MNDTKYSVLMSVYYKENPEHLRQSISSILNQSILPDEIVLIKDGKLTNDLEKVLDAYKENNIFNIVSLNENVGLGKALNIGVSRCKNEFIARMDTDDISEQDRCQKQIELLRKNPDVSVVGTAVKEFIDEPHNPTAYKKVHEKNNAIIKQCKRRNPMNHPSVMFKKTDVISAGNYQPWHFNEDYYLWIRMMERGFKFRNINEPLVNMRVTDDTYMRRGGWKYFVVQKKLFHYMKKQNFINTFEYIYNNTVSLVIRVILPNRLRKFIYLNILRDTQ